MTLINILITDKNIVVIQERLNRVIKQFEIWFSNNSLIINTDKTKVMSFHFNKTYNLVKSKIVFKNVEISYTPEEKCKIKKKKII
jgi:hypothetical protein